MHSCISEFLAFKEKLVPGTAGGKPPADTGDLVEGLDFRGLIEATTVLLHHRRLHPVASWSVGVYWKAEDQHFRAVTSHGGLES